MNSTRITSFRRTVVAGLTSTALLSVLTTAVLATPTTPVQQNQAAACGAACVETQTLDVGGIAYPREFGEEVIRFLGDETRP
ncbi:MULTISPECIES: hypothetical protein [unclassified Mesorhizobium]|uniref:hypothetical protein n=1 Tax=unclassified Mesorhizobium TaxID=325217 RepID=UPI003339191E